MSDSITQEEYDSLSYDDKMFYLRHHKYTDCKVINGKLHTVEYPKPRLSWKRFLDFYNALPLDSFKQVPEGEIGFYKTSNYPDWNPCGMKYIEYGFQYVLYVEVQTPDYSEEGKQKEKELLINWLLEHGATAEELKSIYWNWSGYSAKFICRFTEVPYAHIPEKMHKWLKKNPQWKHKVYSQEILNGQN